MKSAAEGKIWPIADSRCPASASLGAGANECHSHHREPSPVAPRSASGPKPMQGLDPKTEGQTRWSGTKPCQKNPDPRRLACLVPYSAVDLAVAKGYAARAARGNPLVMSADEECRPVLAVDLTH